MKKQLDDITPILNEEFIFSELDHLWKIKPNTKIGCFIPLEDRIRFYLIDYLQFLERQEKSATFDQIILNVMPNLINGTTPANQTILNVLEKIAYSPDGKHWQFGKSDIIQMELDLGISFENPLFPSLDFPKDPNKIEHDCIIYILAKIALSAGLKVHIGKKEQATSHWNGESFNQLSLNKLPIQKPLTDWQKNKIQQIDLIWFDNQGDPVFAFEVETSTPITTGIERFMEVLEIFPNLAKSLVLIIPPKRLSKMNKLLKDSHYIGHPLYMENKLVYSFSQKIVEVYQKVSALNPVNLETVIREIQLTLIAPSLK